MSPQGPFFSGEASAQHHPRSDSPAEGTLPFTFEGLHGDEGAGAQGELVLGGVTLLVTVVSMLIQLCWPPPCSPWVTPRVGAF